MPDLDGPPAGAVFLSYAREDAAAAGRIADALRGFGMVVWLDQDELRGGDAWDDKIRRQIRECRLFVALISATTQSRGEGYFRREWKLAVERTHDMAAGVPFLIPVVVDDTAEADAIVPDEFMKVQWTRLKAGVPSTAFVENLRRLLSAPPPKGSAARASVRTAPAAPPRRSAAVPLTILALVTLGALAALVYKFKAVNPAAPASQAAAPAQAADPKSIAVLPFENMSTEKDNDFFADGVHEDVITNLAKIRELKVISRPSVLAYRDAAVRNLKKIAADLRVANLLVGSVRRFGSKVRVTAQLIDARTDENLWAESYDGDVSDIFAVQATIAREIASALKANLSEGERALIAARPTQNQEAFDLYLRAREVDINYSLASTREQIDGAISLYEGAVAKDPTFALGFVQLAIANSYLYWFGYMDPTPARLERARLAAIEAVRVAPDLPESHLALGAYDYRCLRDWDRALSEFLAAEKGMPNDAELAYWIALSYRRMGRLKECLPYLERSVALNPKSGVATTMLLDTLNMLRRYPRVLEVYANTRVEKKDQILMGEYLLKARAETGLEHYSHAEGVSQMEWSSVVDPLGYVAAYQRALGRHDYAGALKVLEDPSMPAIVGPSNVLTESVQFHRARVNYLLGRTEAARAMAQEALVLSRSLKPSPRQEPFRLMNVAYEEAILGRAAEAARDGKSAVAEGAARDKVDGPILEAELLNVYGITGDREAFLGLLRTMFDGPTAVGPEWVREEPLLARFKGDPDAEAILASVRPL